jgi:3-methyl-2-oxobutanoate hydroxymethyltransferase
MKSLWDFQKMKNEKRKITMVTAYDFSMGKILEDTHVDMILVGDSVAMVVHGYENTLHADMNMMEMHTKAVRRGALNSFIVADMPFLSFRKGVHEAVTNAGILMKAGADAVKVEGLKGHEDVVCGLIESGIPVMGHLGLTPQSIFQLGGFKLQGKTLEQQKIIREDAQKLQELGAFSVVLECVPEKLAQDISLKLDIPVIGIGAGRYVDGQVLVSHDLLGANPKFKPKFVRTYQTQYENNIKAILEFDKDVKNGSFPNNSEIYQ